MSHPARPAHPALARVARLWFLTFLLAQLAFAFFIIAFFTPPLLSGDYAAWNDKPHLVGYVPGDTVGNAQLLVHVYLGALVTLLGSLQFVAAIRRRYPVVHRWIGRVFLGASLVATLGGFYLTWVRGAQINAASTLSISLNGVLILVFAVLAFRSAWRRDFVAHRRHATRAFLLVNGVLFLRVGIMLAGVLLTPLGIRVDYDGGVFIAVSFLSWLAPLALYEAYLWAERSTWPAVRHVATTVIGLAAVATLAGAVAAAMFMWWPRL